MSVIQALLRKECGLEVAVGPAQLVTSAYWTLRGASAFVAGKLGTTVTHVLQQHSMLHMTKVPTSCHSGFEYCYISLANRDDIIITRLLHSANDATNRKTYRHDSPTIVDATSTKFSMVRYFVSFYLAVTDVACDSVASHVGQPDLGL